MLSLLFKILIGQWKSNCGNIKCVLVNVDNYCLIKQWYNWGKRKGELNEKENRKHIVMCINGSNYVSGKCTAELIERIMDEEKKNPLNRVVFDSSILQKYFPQKTTAREMEMQILQLSSLRLMQQLQQIHLHLIHTL